MALYFELTSAQGTTARIALQPGMQRIQAAIGDTYRVYDDATGRTPPGIVVKRLDSHMIVEGLPQDVQIELTDFYARCGVSSPCTMLIDTDASSSSGPLQISPASPPLQALTDGSFVLYPSGYSAEPAIAVADSEGFPRATAYAVGGLAIVALAGAASGGGGGGGGSDGPVVVAPLPEPVPQPAPSPVAPPAPQPVPPGPGNPTPPDQPPDASAPGAPRILAIIDDVPTRVGVIGDNGRTNDRSPTIQGRLDAALTADERLEVLRDGQVLNAPVAFNGLAWTVTDSGLAFGSAYSYSARVVDAAGRAGTSDNYRIVVQAGTDNAASVTAVTDDVAPRTGNVANGSATNDTTPTVSGTLADPLAAGESLQVLRNGIAITAAVAIEGDNWRFTDARLADGSYIYTARVIDAEGSSPLSAGYRITVDTVNNKTATITSVTDNVAPGVGAVRDGGSTNDSTPTFNGRLSSGLAAGEELQVLRDDNVITSSPTVIGTGWSFTDTLAQSGNYNYTVRVVDEAGNIGRESKVFDLRLALPRGAEVESLAVAELLTSDAQPFGATLVAIDAGNLLGYSMANSLDQLLAS